MAKHISDSERLALASLNRKETELKQTREKLSKVYAELKAVKTYMAELKDSNVILANQVKYLVSKLK